MYNFSEMVIRFETARENNETTNGKFTRMYSELIHTADDLYDKYSHLSDSEEDMETSAVLEKELKRLHEAIESLRTLVWYYEDGCDWM